jgi:hypothetical protein
MLSLCTDPKLGIILNGLENVVGRYRFLQLNPCVSLIPDDPTDKHGEVAIAFRFIVLHFDMLVHQVLMLSSATQPLISKVPKSSISLTILETLIVNQHLKRWLEEVSLVHLQRV